MAHKASLRYLRVILKDKVELSKAVIVSSSKNQALNLSLLRATTRDYFTPPHPRYISILLSYGLGSRATAATAIDALMNRLQSAKDSSVAIKCLVIAHHIMKHGSFILVDQLTVYPNSGGRNYLNLSKFRDSSSLVAWELSSLVRWYARFLEHQIRTSRVLGFVLSSTANAVEREKVKEKIRTQTNIDLIHEMEHLVALLEDCCKRPEPLLRSNKMVDQIWDMVGQDVKDLMDVISDRVVEFHHRLGCLSFNNSIDLASVLKRLEGCKQGIAAMSLGTMDSLWLHLIDLKQKIERHKPLNAAMDRGLLSSRGEEQWSLSQRFHGDVVKQDDRLKVRSARFNRDGF